MKLNKVTRLYPKAGQVLDEIAIQEHLDEHNTAGWSLVTVDFIAVGWYRFFWEKESV